MSRKALEMGQLPLSTGSVKGTWRKGCCTEDSDRHVREDSGNGAFHLQDSVRGQAKAISNGGLGQYVYCAGTCT